MDTLERFKLIKELKSLYAQKASEENALARLKIIKKIKALRKTLGLKNRPKSSDDNKTDRKTLTAEITKFFKENLQGKTIVASDSNKIFFNKNQSDHLIHDGRIGDIAKEAVKRIIEVFETGEPTGRHDLNHERTKDTFVAFYGYVKFLDIDGYRCLVEAKAGQKSDTDTLETPTQLIAYSSRVYEKLKNATNSLQSVELGQAGSSQTDSISNSLQSVEAKQAGSLFDSVYNDSNTLFDKIQVDYVVDNFAVLTILDIEPISSQPIETPDNTATPASATHKITMGRTNKLPTTCVA